MNQETRETVTVTDYNYQLWEAAASSLAQAIQDDCMALCERNGLTECEARTALAIADDLGRRVALSSIQVMKTPEFWEYIGIARRTVIEPSGIFREKVVAAIRERDAGRCGESAVD